VEQSEHTARQVRPYRPPIGIPAARENGRLGVAISIALHAILAALLLVPFATHVVQPILQGAGGPGPAGGGGGGQGGTGGAKRQAHEGLRFIQVAPEPPPAAPKAVTPAPPVVMPPRPVEPPPVEEPPKPEAPETKVDVASASAPTAGTGGGTGSDGTNGTGSGSGGGIGTGVGTGRGSGIGPGTGGGTQANYPPVPVEMYLQPMPIPDRLRGFRVIAEFDVDETGRVVSFTFTETRDAGYNRRLREVVRSIRFRPGSRPDGTPIRMKAQVEWTL
jgi:protein TonB